MCRDINEYWNRRWNNIPCAEIDTPIRQICTNCPRYPVLGDNGDYLWHGRCNNGRPTVNRFNKHLQPKCQQNRGRLMDMLDKTSCTPEFLKFFLLSEDFGKGNCEYQAEIDDPFERRGLENISHAKSKNSRGAVVPLINMSLTNDVKNWYPKYTKYGCKQNDIKSKRVYRNLLAHPRKEKNSKRRKNVKWLDQLNSFYQTIAEEDMHDLEPELEDIAHIEPPKKGGALENPSERKTRKIFTQHAFVQQKKINSKEITRNEKVNEEQNIHADFVPLKMNSVYHEPYDRSKPWTYAQKAIKLPANVHKPHPLLGSTSLMSHLEGDERSSFNLMDNEEKSHYIRPSEGFRKFLAKTKKEDRESFIAPFAPTYPRKRPYIPGVDLRDPKTIYEEYMSQFVPSQAENMHMPYVKSRDSLQRGKSRKTMVVAK